MEESTLVVIKTDGVLLIRSSRIVHFLVPSERGVWTGNLQQREQAEPVESFVFSIGVMWSTIHWDHSLAFPWLSQPRIIPSGSKPVPRAAVLPGAGAAAANLLLCNTCPFNPLLSATPQIYGIELAKEDAQCFLIHFQ